MDTQTTEQTEAGIGHNQSPYEVLKSRIDDVIAATDNAIEQFPEITEQSVADEFTSLIDMIRACEKEAETMRKEEKAPHDAAIKDIQARYKAFTDNLGLAVAVLKRRVTAFLVKKEREAEEARKAAEAEALRVMEEAEAAERAAQDSGSVSAQIKAQEAKEQADQAVKEVSAPVGPARAKGEFSSRAIGLRTVYSAQIDDLDAVYAHFKTDPKVREVLQSLANAAARAAKGDAGRFQVPGARLHEEKQAA